MYLFGLIQKKNLVNLVWPQTRVHLTTLPKIKKKKEMKYSFSHPSASTIIICPTIVKMSTIGKTCGE